MLKLPLHFRYLAALALSSLALYVVLLPINAPLYDLILFPFPDPRIPDKSAELTKLRASGIVVKDVEFKSSNGRLLHGWFLKSPDTKRVFLYCHAKGNNIYGKLHVLDRAEHAGFNERVKTVNASMHSLPFEDNEFNVIWCEGAMYIMGVPLALTNWKRLLAPGGFIAFTQPCFLRGDLPAEVKEHWADYAAMTNVETTLKIIEGCGYMHIDHFTIPESSWWHDYYTPQEARLGMLRQKYANSPSALARIEETQKEIDTHRKFAGYYGYVFFVIRKPGR